MKYIAIFSGYYYPHLGGIERYIDSMMKEFIKLGYTPILVTSNYNNTKNYQEVNGIKIIRLPVFNIFKNRYPIIKLNQEEKELLNILDNYKIESIIVNTRFHLTSHIGAKYGQKNNIPVYLIEHGSNYVTLDNKFIDFFANRYEDFLTWKIRKKIKGFYGVSNACSQWLKQLNIKANGTWYNSIDIKQKVPKKEKSKKINFLYAGRLIKQKGVENILNSFKKLEKKYNNIQLYIAGDGPELEKYKRNYNSKNIFFLGKLDYQNLLKYYAKTDIFLYPPLWPEGLPTSILEAGLMHCAIIGTNQGGIKEVIINKENGIIVDATEDNLYKAMEKLIVNDNLRIEYATKLYKTIETKFSWEVTAKKILKDMEVYNEKK